MSKRFDYVKYGKESMELSEALKESYTIISDALEMIVAPNRDVARTKALALTKLEESFMWAGKMIRDGQISLNGNSEHLPERNDS